MTEILKAKKGGEGYTSDDLLCEGYKNDDGLAFLYKDFLHPGCEGESDYISFLNDEALNHIIERVEVSIKSDFIEIEYGVSSKKLFGMREDKIMTPKEIYNIVSKLDVSRMMREDASKAGGGGTSGVGGVGGGGNTSARPNMQGGRS